MELLCDGYYCMETLLEAMLIYDGAQEIWDALGCCFVCLLILCGVGQLLMGCLWCIWIWEMWFVACKLCF